MTHNQINWLNSFLMLLALGLAFKWPYETFVLAYGYLGPAHYLTQISWLHDRDYFTAQKRKGDPLWLVIPAILLGFISVGPQIFGLLVWCAFGMGFYLVYGSKVMSPIPGIVSVLIGGFILMDYGWWLATFIVFLPTIIHVYLFTGLFVLFGGLKARSSSAMISFGIFVICGALPFVIMPDASAYSVAAHYDSAARRFIVVQDALLRFTGLPSDWNCKVAVMRFIAFSYLYHYLNWFSKTKIIGWAEIPERRAWIIVALYTLFAGFYTYDYGFGVKAVFFLSIAHVFLEFPLNFRSIAGIARELPQILRPNNISSNPPVVK